MLNNGGFCFEPDEKENCANDFFEKTNVNSILGKNLVKNFVGKIEFEVKYMGFSESANLIAQFYDYCINNKSIIEFVNNDVIKMILKEIENNFTVRNYLYTRIFDEVNSAYIKRMEEYYTNQDEMYNKNKIQEQDFKKDLILKQREIDKIMVENNCDEEQAKKIIENKKSLDKIEKINNKIKAQLDDYLKKGLLTISDDKTIPNNKSYFFDDDEEENEEDTFFKF